MPFSEYTTVYNADMKPKWQHKQNVHFFFIYFALFLFLFLVFI